jgi:hypothetical protein
MLVNISSMPTTNNDYRQEKKSPKYGPEDLPMTNFTFSLVYPLVSVVCIGSARFH